MPSSISRAFYVLMLAAVAVSADARSARAGIAHLILDSAPGSYIGDGHSYDITDSNAAAYTIYPSYNLPDGEWTSVTISVFQSTFIDARLTFSTHKLGIAVGDGAYTNAQRFGFEDPGHPGLDVTFSDEGSNVLTGSFTVTDATFYKDAHGAYQLASFAATFDQVSDNATSHVSGSITYDAAVAPEPSSIVLFGVAGLGLGVARVRRRRSA